MKAFIDPETCIGCGVCEEVCPDVFQMTDDDLATVKAEEVPADAEDACRDAAEECPVDAITLEE